MLLSSMVWAWYMSLVLQILEDSFWDVHLRLLSFLSSQLGTLFPLYHGSSQCVPLGPTFRTPLNRNNKVISFYLLVQMYRFKVHAVKRSKTQPSLWAPSAHTFGHKDLVACQLWVNRINAYIHMEAGRPKNLLVCCLYFDFSVIGINLFLCWNGNGNKLATKIFPDFIYD